MRTVAPRRLRPFVLALVAAIAVAGLIQLLAGGKSDPKPLPEAGSSFGAGVREEGDRGSLLDALAPVLTPRAVVVAGTRASSDGRAKARSPLPLPLPRAVAQLFVVGFEGVNPSAPFFERLAVRDWGGVILGDVNYEEPSQVTTLTDSIFAVAGRAGHATPLVAASQPGGEESAFANLPPRAQVEISSPRAAAREAELAGKQLRALGVHMTLAPVADLGVSGGAWEGRAFSDQPAAVSALTRAAVSGYRRARVAAAPGHFPGEGAASQDPADGPASVGLGVDQLRERDMRPFARVAKTAPAILMSNALYAGFDGVTPATLLPDAVRALRDLGFRGVVVSGDLSAVTLATGGSVASAAVAAFKAGCDLLLVPGDADDQEQAWAAVLRAVRRGEISEARLATSLRRVTELKRRFVLAAG